jgi:hypothetical protein
MDFIKVIIMEDEWVLYLIDDDDNVVTDDNIRAEVLHEKKEIYFRPDDLNLSVVLHELWHVYFGYCFTSDANLDAGQLEEISCSLFADRAEVIIARGKDILSKLKSLKKGVKK